MNPKREALLLMALCAVLVLASLGGLVFGFTAGLFYPQMDMDGLLLLLVALSLGGVFSLMLLWLANDAGYLEPIKARLKRKPRETEAAPAAKAPAQPAAQPAAGNPGPGEKKEEVKQ